MNNYKTYIIGVCSILFAVTGMIIHQVDANTAFTMISTALLAMGLRHGISKTTQQ